MSTSIDQAFIKHFRYTKGWRCDGGNGLLISYMGNRLISVGDICVSPQR
ncbi:MAG: hypothetical protein AB8B83_07200 [Bdellovibrionales bacterium]